MESRKGYKIYQEKNPYFSTSKNRKVPRSCCVNPRDESSVERCVADPDNPTHTYHEVWALVSKTVNNCIIPFILGLLCQNEELCEGPCHAGWWYRHRHSVHSHYRNGPLHGTVLHDRLVAGNLSSSSPILHSPKCTVQLCCKFVFPLPSNYNSIILLFVFFFLLASTKHFLAVPRFPHSHNKHRCLHNCKLIQNTCSTIHYARETLSLRCLHHHQSDNGSQAEQHEKNRTKILFSRMLNSFMHTSYKNNEG